jgi:hypothetical protein
LSPWLALLEVIAHQVENRTQHYRGNVRMNGKSISRRGGNVYARSVRVLLHVLPFLTRLTIISQQRDDSRYPCHQALVTSVLQAIQSAGTSSLVVRLAWRGVAVQPHFMHSVHID